MENICCVQSYGHGKELEFLQDKNGCKDNCIFIATGNESDENQKDFMKLHTKKKKKKLYIRIIKTTSYIHTCTS